MIIRVVVAVLGGTALLIWTAFFNGYPLLFSDSGGFLHQTLGPLMLWDKPYIYGPFLHAFHLRISLWGPVIAQGLILSHLLWLMQRAVCARATPLWHIGLCAFAALATAAPFSAALLMPDIFAPIVVLGLFLLGFGGAALTRFERGYLLALVALGIAAHLAHLLGRIDEDRVAYHQQVVAGAYGLSTALPRDSRADDLIALMMADKKALHGLTFVLDGPNGVELVADVSTAVVTQALSRMEVR